jgi:hypothetical protein
LPHDQWTANVGEAVANLEALASSSETAFALHLQKVQCYHYLCPSSSTSVFDNPVSELVCDALVTYYYPQFILDAIYDFDDRSQEFHYRNHYPTYSPSFLILLAACYSGDIIFLQQALNDERIFRENTGYHNLVSSCLRVVSQQGHLRVMQYLLDAGFDVNHIGFNYGSAIIIAADGGNQHLLELLLRPEYGLKRSGDQYKFALHAAADHHDTTTRLENVKTLYLVAEELPQPRTRENLLFRACRTDDMALARWLLADGPVDMYSAVGMVPLKTQSMLHWLAQQGKSEWLQWFLQVQPPRILENNRHRRIIAAALSAAAYGNHLEIFLEFAKFFEHNLKRLCLLSAVVENGLPQLVTRFPSLDLQSMLSQEITEGWLREATVGSQALREAISRGRSSNVQMLLERGVRTSGGVSLRQSRYEKDRTSFTAIQTMLINHANPVFTVRCDPYPAACGWGLRADTRIRPNGVDVESARGTREALPAQTFRPSV